MFLLQVYIHTFVKQTVNIKIIIEKLKGNKGILIRGGVLSYTHASLTLRSSTWQKYYITHELLVSSSNRISDGGSKQRW